MTTDKGGDEASFTPTLTHEAGGSGVGGGGGGVSAWAAAPWDFLGEKPIISYSAARYSLIEITNSLK